MLSSVVELRAKVETQLRERLPDNLLRVEATVPGMTLPEPRTWTRLTDFSRLPEEQSPAIYITAATLDRIALDIDDETGAAFEKVEAALKVFVVVAGRSPEETSARVPMYVAATRYSLNDDLTLGTDGSIVGRRGAEDYGELPAGKGIYIGAGSLVFYYRFNMPTSAPRLPDEPGGIKITKVRVHPMRLEF